MLNAVHRVAPLTLLCASFASAAPLIDLGVEGAAAIPLDNAASTFGAGGSGAARVQLQLAGPLRVQAGAGFLSVGAREAGAASGNALWGGAGARLKLLEGARDSLWGFLWVDAQADVVGTGPDVRFGYELGVGAQLEPAWPLGVGPFVRFMHIVDAPGPASADAFIFSAGLSVTLGSFPSTRPPPPLDTTHDGDGDGVPDERDQCRDEAETINGFQDTDGCPDAVPIETTTKIAIKQAANTDRDGDGFVDERDRCPEDAEVFNGVEDDDGCGDPGEALVTLTATALELRQPLKLERLKGAWRPARTALPMLSAAAVVLSLHPEFRLVRIEARAERQATREAAIDVSLKRAEGVRRALVELGLDANRLEAVAVPEPALAKDRVELFLVR